MHQLINQAASKDLEVILSILKRKTNLVQIKDSVNHVIKDKTYIRHVSYRKGQLVVGRVHKYPHTFVLVQGRVTIWSSRGKTTLEAPAMVDGEPGIQRVAFFHADSVCMNIHSIPDNTTVTPENADDVFTEVTENLNKLVSSLESTLLLEGV